MFFIFPANNAKSNPGARFHSVGFDGEDNTENLCLCAGMHQQYCCVIVFIVK